LEWFDVRLEYGICRSATDYFQPREDGE
jgi:hypothetical protein